MSSRDGGRRSSKTSKYHQQYLSFLRKWKNYIRSNQYEECEQLCLDHINKVAETIALTMSASTGGTVSPTGSRFAELKAFRSKVRNLYAVLLHDYLKRHTEALEQYEYCISDDPTNASAHYNWAILYKNHFKNYRKAEEHYKKAIELKPKHAAYHNNYGLLLEQQLRDYDRALKCFKKALELDPSNGRAHTNMANLLKKYFKDYNLAKFHYRKAIDMDPNNPIRHFNFALFLKHSLRDYESAATEYEISLKLDPTYQQAATEYKAFLLRESPISGRRKPRKATVVDSTAKDGAMSLNLTEVQQKRIHSSRCVRQCIIALWNAAASGDGKKTSGSVSSHGSDASSMDEARELLSMSLKCNPKNRIAQLLKEPNRFMHARFYHVFDTDPMAAVFECQKYNRINRKWEKWSMRSMDSFMRHWDSRMRAIILGFGMKADEIESNAKRAKEAGSAAEIISEDSALSPVGDPSSDDGSWSKHELSRLWLETKSEWKKWMTVVEKLRKKAEGLQIKSELFNRDGTEDYRAFSAPMPGTMPDADIGGGLGTGVATTIVEEDAMAPYHYIYGDESDQESTDSDESDDPYGSAADDDDDALSEAGSYALTEPLPGAKKKGKKKGGGTSFSRRGMSRDFGSKRHSFRSVGSGLDRGHQDYTMQRVDFQKKDVVSSLSTVRSLIENGGGGSSSSSSSVGGLSEDQIEKLQTVAVTLERTLKTLETVTDTMNGNIGGGSVGGGASSVIGGSTLAGLVAAGRRGGAGGAGGSGRFDDTASAVSQATIAMDQRRQFLKDASHNPEVRAADRAVATHLQTFFKKEHSTAGGLPSFEDADADDDDAISVASSATGVHAERSAAAAGAGGVLPCTMTTASAMKKAGEVLAKTKTWLSEPGVEAKLVKINDWDFDVFGLVSIAGHFGMGLLFLKIANERNLIEELGLNSAIISNFFYHISKQYKSNPYHNREHGCDVMVNVNYFMRARVFEEIDKLDILAGLIASACHDVGHRGYNNAFEMATESENAVVYNDVSVLENMHISLTWRTLQRDGCNALTGLSSAQRKYVRRQMIDAVLATDMAKHSAQQDALTSLIDDIKLKSGVNLKDWSHPGRTHSSVYSVDEEDDSSVDEAPQGPIGDPSTMDDETCIFHNKKKLANILIPLAVHTADLANPTKTKLIYCRWADRVVNEFWHQGDVEAEKGLPVTPFMDRRITDKPTSQTGFINHVVKPWFGLWGQILVDPDQGPVFHRNTADNLAFMQEEMKKAQAAKAEAKRAEEEAAAAAAASSTADGGGSTSPSTEGGKLKASGSRSPGPKLKPAKSMGDLERQSSSSGGRGKKMEPHLMPRGTVQRREKAMSIMAMTFEDITKAQMQKQVREMDALRKQQQALDEDCEIDDDLSSLRHPKSTRDVI